MARRALSPATLAVVQAVDAALAATELSLVVACSGGADSLALAAAAAHVGRRRSLALAGVVVDHGLAAGSASVAARAGQQLAGLGYSDVVVRRVWVDPGARCGPEAAARTARYACLRSEAEARGGVVLLGHTLDDQAETVLLSLARGSGIRSLAGMAELTDCYIRPLLGLRRTTTEAACRELHLPFWTDPHNSVDRYARSRVRGRVLPVLEAELGPGVAESLARTARLAREDADLLDALALAAHPSTPALECGVLEQLPAPLRRRVIRRWLTEQGARDVSLTHVLGVEELVVAWHGQSGVDLPGVRATRRAGQLHCSTGQARNATTAGGPAVAG